MKMRHAVIAVSVGVICATAWAATSPLLTSSVVNSGVLSIITNALPKGWFFSGGAFDRPKTNLRVSYSFAATSCSAAAPGGQVSSVTLGTFTPVTNQAGQATAYVWDTLIDVSSYQNHYYMHQHCDGTTELHGCAEAIAMTVTTTAYDAAGNCRTYIDDAGVTRCASDTDSTWLPAVQDPDVIDTDCGASCGIGPCVWVCEQNCDASFDCAQGTAGASCRATRQACKQACPCSCKLDLPADCPPHDECRD